jgi:hypothetical protein
MDAVELERRAKPAGAWRRHLERNVEADIMALLIHAFLLRVTFDTAELTGCAWSAADALRLLTRRGSLGPDPP